MLRAIAATAILVGLLIPCIAIADTYLPIVTAQKPLVLPSEAVISITISCYAVAEIRRTGSS
jgi:hypothetical protein